MADSPKPISGPEDYMRLKELQRQLLEYVDLVEKCMKCGISCDNESAACFAMKEFLDSVEINFMTPPPAGAIALKD